MSPTAPSRFRRADGTLPPLAGGAPAYDSRVRLRKLREERAECFAKMADIIDSSGGRDMHPDERKRYASLDARVAILGGSDGLGGEIGRLEAEIFEENHGVEAQRRARVVGDSDGADPTRSSTGSGPRLLARSHRVADHAASRGYIGDTRAGDYGERLSIGASIRGILTNRWDGAEEEQRALSSSTLGAGGGLVPTPLATAVIDNVRNQARVLEAGARTVVMDSETLKLPRIIDDPVPQWRNQNEPVAEDDLGFDQVKLEAKTLAVLVRVPWELMQDMTPEGADAIENALIRSLSNKLDLAALRGDGEERTVAGITGREPLGVRNQPGVTIQSLGANGAAVSTYAPFLAGVGAVLGRNMRPNAQLYSTRTALAVAGWAATDGQPLQPPPLLADIAQLPTNQIPDDLTQGTSTDASEIYTGQWDQLIIGFRPQVGVRIVQLDQTFADRMQTGLLAFLRADVGVLHAGAFAVTTGVRPAA